MKQEHALEENDVVPISIQKHDAENAWTKKQTINENTHVKTKRKGHDDLAETGIMDGPLRRVVVTITLHVKVFFH